MKKIFYGLVFCFSLVGFLKSAEAQIYFEGIEEALVLCQNTQQSQNINIFGMDAKVTHKIELLGSDRCQFLTTVETDTNINKTICTFTRKQLDEFAEALTDDGTTEHTIDAPMSVYEEKDGVEVKSDIAANMTFTGSLKEVFWQKYINDESVCQTEETQKDVTSEIKAALAQCVAYEKNLNVMGMGFAVSVKPQPNGLCLFFVKTYYPKFKKIEGDVKSDGTGEADFYCYLTQAQRERTVEFMGNSESGEKYVFYSPDGQTLDMNLMVPDEYAQNPQICSSNLHYKVAPKNPTESNIEMSAK